MAKISIFVDISIDLSRNGEIEIFRVWHASIDLSRPRIRTQFPSLVDIFQVHFELRPSLMCCKNRSKKRLAGGRGLNL